MFARLTFAALTLAVAATTAQAQQYVQLTCDIGGTPGHLSAQIDHYERGYATGGDPVTFVSGQISTPATTYTFSGEAQFADFVDTSTGARFLVEFVPQSWGLTLVADPYGSAQQFHCS